MLPAVAQTLAKLLATDTSLHGTECIDFNPPREDGSAHPGLSLYCYSITEHTHNLSEVQCSPSSATAKTAIATHWFDVSFVISATDYTTLGTHQLLSEALAALLGHSWLTEAMLPPELQGYGDLRLSICPSHFIHPGLLWQSFGVPIRPALYVTITVPMSRQGVYSGA